jgi:hypothetical protein
MLLPGKTDVHLINHGVVKMNKLRCVAYRCTQGAVQIMVVEGQSSALVER